MSGILETLSRITATVVALHDSAEALRGRLERFVAEGGTLVFTSHDSRDVERLADGVIRLGEERVVQRDRALGPQV